MSGETYKVPEQKCPYCGHDMDGTMGTDSTRPRSPKKDDLSICLTCQQVSKFDSNLIMQKVNEEELRQIVASNPSLGYAMLKAKAAICAVNPKRRAT